MAEDKVVISLESVSKKYKLFGSKLDRMKEALHPLQRRYHKEFFALNDINLQVRQGEVLGIVGMNGSGKSTLLKIISGIIQPTGGSVNVTGNVVPLLELGSWFNPEFSGLENVYFYNSIMGYNRKQTDAIIDQILDFAEIGEFIHQPLKTYSSGMKARLAFAVSVNINPDILILDEVLSVGDELFKRKSFARIEEFFKAGKTIIFVSHSAQSITQLCTRVIMLYNGRIVMDGPAKHVTMNYQKLIFTPVHQRADVLEGLKNLLPDNEQSEKLNEDQLPDETIPGKLQEVLPVNLQRSDAYFIENFNPKSTVILRNANLDISSIRIENILGKEVNCIVPEEEYTISYNVVFSEDIGPINLGIGFKTELGVVVTWRFYPQCNGFSEYSYRNGDVLNVKWKFKCLLIPATYFIGVTIKRNGENGSEIIYKGADIDVFRVIGGKVMDRGGFFDTGFSIELT